MLEIAGGIVLGGVILFVLWLLLPIIGEGLSWMADTLITVVIAFVVLGLLYLSTVPAYALWTWLKRTVGPERANAIADPICFFVAVGLPWILFADSRQEFKGTVWLFRWVVRMLKPSTWKARLWRSKQGGVDRAALNIILSTAAVLSLLGCRAHAGDREAVDRDFRQKMECEKYAWQDEKQDHIRNQYQEQILGVQDKQFVFSIDRIFYSKPRNSCIVVERLAFFDKEWHTTITVVDVLSKETLWENYYDGKDSKNLGTDEADAIKTWQ